MVRFGEFRRVLWEYYTTANSQHYLFSDNHYPSIPLQRVCPLSLPLLHRSQRDVAGEKALREKELQELQKKLVLVEGEIATAENDRRQFDGAVKRGKEKESELRWVELGGSKLGSVGDDWVVRRNQK